MKKCSLILCLMKHAQLSDSVSIRTLSVRALLRKFFFLISSHIHTCIFISSVHSWLQTMAMQWWILMIVAEEWFLWKIVKRKILRLLATIDNEFKYEFNNITWHFDLNLLLKWEGFLAVLMVSIRLISCLNLDHSHGSRDVITLKTLRRKLKVSTPNWIDFHGPLSIAQKRNYLYYHIYKWKY